MLTQGQCHCNTVKQHVFFFFFVAFVCFSAVVLFYKHCVTYPIPTHQFIWVHSNLCFKIFSNNIFQIKLVFKDIFQTLLIVDDIWRHLSVFLQARSRFLGFQVCFIISQHLFIRNQAERKWKSLVPTMFCAVTWTVLTNLTFCLSLLMYYLLSSHHIS